MRKTLPADPTLPLVEYTGIDSVRIMIFVDGENLTMRSQDFEKEYRDHGVTQRHDNVHVRDVCLWNPALSDWRTASGLIRTYYYTAVVGDDGKVDEVVDTLKVAGVAAPRVFKKAKGRPSKRVDISLSIDMLNHAARGHFDLGILVTGDEDYVPLVRAVQAEGRGVHVWSVPSGVSRKLVDAADSFSDISAFLFRTD